MVCLCLTKPRLDDNTQLIETYHAYIDIVELRVDTLDKDEQTWEAIESWARHIVTLFPIKMICTIRLQIDGGAWVNRYEERLSILTSAVASGLFSFVDIEEAIHRYTTTKISVDHMLALTHPNTTLIISQHIFDTHATRIAVDWKALIITLAHKYPSCIIKSAISCNNSTMTYDFFAQCRMLHEEIPHRYIVAPMGIYGLPARVLRVHTGSLLTFTSDITPDGLSHLGHIDPKTLVETYQYHNITPRTQIFGIIGNPVMHSQSPQLHNNYFMAAGMQDKSHSPNKVYIHIPLDDCQAIPLLAPYINLRGLSVTIPHKNAILPHVDELHHEVQVCKSCNTVIIDDQGTWHGYNTDISGFLSPLYRALDIPDIPNIGISDTDIIHADMTHQVLSTYRICVVGAGGSSYAICYGLLRAGAKLLITNRTQEKATMLSKNLLDINPRFDISTCPLDDYTHIAEYSDIIIQTSSVGMNDDTATPLPNYPFKGTELVYDIIYTPPNTKIMKDAQARGCKVISGKEMFMVQGKLQSLYFTRL